MKPNSEPHIKTNWTIVATVLFLLAMAMFIFLVKSEAQTVYEVKPVIKEKVDTVKMCDATVYMFKDGAAWVEEKNSLAFYSKKYFGKWKRKRKNVRTCQQPSKK